MAKDLESKQLQLTEEFLNLQKKYQALYISKMEQKIEPPADPQNSISGKRPRAVKKDDGESSNKAETASELELPSSKRLRIEAEPFVPHSLPAEAILVTTIGGLEPSEVTESVDKVQEEAADGGTNFLQEQMDQVEVAPVIDGENEDDIKPYEDEEDDQATYDDIIYAADVTEDQMEVVQGLQPSGMSLHV